MGQAEGRAQDPGVGQSYNCLSHLLPRQSSRPTEEAPDGGGSLWKSRSAGTPSAPPHS